MWSEQSLAEKEWLNFALKKNEISKPWTKSKTCGYKIERFGQYDCVKDLVHHPTHRLATSRLAEFFLDVFKISLNVFKNNERRRHEEQK